MADEVKSYQIRAFNCDEVAMVSSVDLLKIQKLIEENQRLRSALEEITESDDDGSPAWSQRDMIDIAKAALDGDRFAGTLDKSNERERK